MKKYISFMIVAGLVLSFSLATVARAEDGGIKARVDTSTSVKLSPQGEQQEDGGNRQEDRQGFMLKLKGERQDFLAQLKTDRASFLAEVKAKKEAWKNDNADRKVQFCQAVKEAFMNRFDTATSRLEMYQGKVSGIIVEVKASGKDTTEAQASLDLSVQKLGIAKAKLNALKALVPVDCTSLTADQFETLKVGARDAKDLLKESRQALHEAIQDLRSLKGENVEVDASAKASIKN